MTRTIIAAGALLALTCAAFRHPALAAPQEKAPTASQDEKLKSLEARQAETAAALEALRKELASVKPAEAYAELASKLEALERQLQETKAALEALRSAPARREPGPVEPTGLVPKSFPLFGSSGQVSSGTSFNPSISVIPDVVYSHDDVGGSSAEILEEADGFHGSHAEEGHEHGGLSQGFNLRETELSFTASVDAYFDVVALFAASEEGLETEEVYFQTRRLPGGFQLKGGKFLSGFGYANAHHPHQWDFVDQNLAYELLLGGHGLNEKGVQISWLPKLPLYLRLGGELLQGENEKLANSVGPEEFPGYTEGDDPRVLSGKSGPRLFTGFVKVGPNLGYSSALQLGASFAYGSVHQEVHDEDGDGNPESVLDGSGSVWGVDLVYKYDSPREYGAGDLVLQAEYLFRTRDLDVLGTPSTVVLRNDGVYVQAVFGVLPRLQLAARWDAAGLTNERVVNGVKADYGTSSRWTGALTFNPTEFSRVRAQYEHARIRVGGEKETYGQLVLQVQLSIGAHGAHKF